MFLRVFKFQAIGLPSSRTQFSTSATQSNRVGWGIFVSCVVLVLFLSSCSSFRTVHRETPVEETSAIAPSYSIVCIIHGDGDYLYHDTDGNAHRADKEALGKAELVAINNPQAEVFIFHEGRRRHALLFFPLRDGKFYYYRNGQLIAEEAYWRDKGQSRFAPEVELYNRFRANELPKSGRFFLYFGHEIPEFDGAGYDASYKNRTFTIDDLAGELKLMTPDSTKFDLVMLSTCFNGTPYSIATLSPYARYIVASPDNLHLSYFDLRPFEQLNSGLQDGDVSAFAKKFAQQAFDRLIDEVQTEVTVTVYDVDRVQGFLRSIDIVYEKDLAKIRVESPEFLEHCDCAEYPAYSLPGMLEGVDVFYRPPRFGRSKHKPSHSGWECWKLPE